MSATGQTQSARPGCRRFAALALAALLAGCATAPPVLLTPEEQYEPELVTVPPMTPLVEYPPIEPVEPPMQSATQTTPAAAPPVLSLIHI